MKVHRHFWETQNDEEVFIPVNIDDELTLVDIAYIAIKSRTKKFVVDKMYEKKCPIDRGFLGHFVCPHTIKNPVIIGLLMLMTTYDPHPFITAIKLPDEKIDDLRNTLKELQKLINFWGLADTALYPVFSQLWDVHMNFGIDLDDTEPACDDSQEEFCELVCPPIIPVKSARNI